MTTALVAASDSTIGPTLAVILGAGMLAQWLAWRAQVPSIIALLVTGLLLGPVTGVVDPDDLLGVALFPLVSLAVAVILFEGGLDLPPRELRHTGTIVRRLVTVGALATFLVAWAGARAVFDLDDKSAVVLAAVLVVTGPTVVGPLLRFVRPAGRVGPILRAESVLIDPIGATAALLAFEVVIVDAPDEAIIKLVGTLALTLIAGIGIGLAAAVVLDVALQRFLVPDQLAVPVTFAFVVGSFVLSNEVQEEAGLLAVTVLGIYLARRESSTIRSVLEFSESLRTLLISALFILLAARIDGDALSDVVLPSLAFLAVLVFIARPLTVVLSTVRTSTTWRERIFLMTMAPRGIVAAAVSAIFAIRLEEEGVEGASKIVPIVFLVIIGTIVVYGFLAGPVARRLGLAEAQANGILIAGAHADRARVRHRDHRARREGDPGRHRPLQRDAGRGGRAHGAPHQRARRGRHRHPRPARCGPPVGDHVERRSERPGHRPLRARLRSARGVPAGARHEATGIERAHRVPRPRDRHRSAPVRHDRRTHTTGVAGTRHHERLDDRRRRDGQPLHSRRPGARRARDLPVSQRPDAHRRRCDRARRAVVAA